mmetsp:Transcript_111802/g.315795  ORF Transcript_111802/g.315795 Transcript_111802/m.315795 type:complete len:288 (+) Transcript_111802:1998-2861(+)
MRRPAPQNGVEARFLNLHELAWNHRVEVINKTCPDAVHDAWRASLLPVLRVLYVGMLLGIDEKNHSASGNRWHRVSEELLFGDEKAYCARSTKQLVRREERNVHRGIWPSWRIEVWPEVSSCGCEIPTCQSSVLMDEARHPWHIGQQTCHIRTRRQDAHGDSGLAVTHGRQAIDEVSLVEHAALGVKPQRAYFNLDIAGVQSPSDRADRIVENRFSAGMHVSPGELPEGQQRGVVSQRVAQDRNAPRALEWVLGPAFLEFRLVHFAVTVCPVDRLGLHADAAECALA